jgi:hypothetical protein
MPTKVAKERGRGSSRTKEREWTRVATLAFLRQRLLLLERVEERGLHHVSAIITVFPIPVPLFQGMDPSGVLSNVSGLWLRVGGGKVHLQTVHKEKAAAVAQVEVATTRKVKGGSIQLSFSKGI